MVTIQVIRREASFQCPGPSQRLTSLGNVAGITAILRETEQRGADPQSDASLRDAGRRQDSTNGTPDWRTRLQQA